MATGQPAFAGNTSAVIFDAILNRTPPAPSSLNPNMPPKLEEIVGKALEKDRDLRCQTAAELRADLKRLKRDTDSSRVGVTFAGPAAASSARSAESIPKQGLVQKASLPVAATTLALPVRRTMHWSVPVLI